MKHALAVATLAAGVALSPAFAQEQKPAEQPPPAAQQQQQEAQPQQEAQKPAAGVEYVAEQQKTDWLASSLMGRTVYNAQNESLGSINEILLDESGQAVAVVIGVGGFLGIGQKEVGVSYASLEFMERPREPAPQQPAAGGQPPSQPPTGVAREQAQPREDPKHGNMIVVLNATKEELQSAPDFARLGQRRDAQPRQN